MAPAQSVPIDPKQEGTWGQRGVASVAELGGSERCDQRETGGAKLNAEVDIKTDGKGPAPSSTWVGWTGVAALATVTKKFVAACLGNWLEWYDFGVYAAVAKILGAHFFPSGDPSVEIMQSFMAFAAGMCPTFLIGCLPTYAHVGYLSTVLLVVLRLLQGIAIGGGDVSALVFSMEHAPGHQKTLSGALMRLGSNVGLGAWLPKWSITVAVGTFSGFGVVALMQSFISDEAMNDFGWRICFWLGLLVGLVGLFLRSQARAAAWGSHGGLVSDPEEFVQARELRRSEAAHPLWLLWRKHRVDVLLMVGTEAITPAAWPLGSEAGDATWNSGGWMRTWPVVNQLLEESISW
eukprot:Skav224516  [mRNA]  locus=scaffold4480:47469:54992:+ [translate_table: standard]